MANNGFLNFPIFGRSDRHARNRSFSVPNYPVFEPAQPLLEKGQPIFPNFPPVHFPPAYGSAVHLAREIPYGIPLQPMSNGGVHQPMVAPMMMPYRNPQPQMPPMIANQGFVPHSQAPPIPTNIVVNSNTNPSGNRSRNDIVAALMGGFVCPFCHIGVQIRYRNPWIKYGIIVIAILTFPIGLVCCFCSSSCGHKTKCTTCNRKI